MTFYYLYFFFPDIPTLKSPYAQDRLCMFISTGLIWLTLNGDQRTFNDNEAQEITASV